MTKRFVNKKQQEKQRKQDAKKYMKLIQQDLKKSFNENFTVVVSMESISQDHGHHFNYIQIQMTKILGIKILKMRFNWSSLLLCVGFDVTPSSTDLRQIYEDIENFKNQIVFRIQEEIRTK